MEDRQLYAQILGIGKPWEVTRVELNRQEGEVRVFVSRVEGPVPCPECGDPGAGYGERERQWRHLDTCQYRTILVAKVPRIRCSKHGVRQVAVPWGEPGSRFTALFEALAIDWLREASFSAVARQLHLTWHQIAGIQARAVRRGLARRATQRPRRIGVDETSFQKRHEYVTVINDLDAGMVLHVADDRKRESLDAFYSSLGPAGCEGLQVVAMDMWGPYISSTHAHVPGATKKLLFDKFHIAQHLGEAVDKVRRAENRELLATGDDSLKNSRYLWLTNPTKLSPVQAWRFDPLRKSRLRAARAWALKESAMALWGYSVRGWAERAWTRWCSWAVRCRLDPVKQVARMIQRHWEGVINAATNSITNARSESVNARVQWLKRMACGYRNRENFRNAIYFHLGGLDLYPSGVTSINPKP
jgi:transposase